MPTLREVQTNKIHLNYDNFSNHQTNFVDWNLSTLFMGSGAAHVDGQSMTNPPPFNVLNAQGQQVSVPGTNFHLIGDTYVNRDFSLTNIQVWPEKAPGIHEYTANAHQLLQLAANLTEPVTTNRPFAPACSQHL